jgi:hypothetical protein
VSPQAAATVARTWTRLYTATLPPNMRDARRAEIESDLWESLTAADGSRQILARLALGAIDDLSWSVTFMDTTTRTTAGWSLGSLAILVLSWLWLSLAPQSVVMRESQWAFPTALIFHLLGLVLFVGMRLPLDLRLTGLAFSGVPVSQLASRTAPWALVGAIVTIVSGMALYSADTARIASNPAFQIKVVMLVAALLNAWVFHAVLRRRIAEWEQTAAPPVVVRASGYVSLLLWSAVLVAGKLTPFVGN